MSDASVKLDGKRKALQAQWRRLHEASTAVRADLDRLKRGCAANEGLVHVARLRLEQLEVSKARTMENIEQLEDPVSGGHWVTGRN